MNHLPILGAVLVPGLVLSLAVPTAAAVFISEIPQQPFSGALTLALNDIKQYQPQPGKTLTDVILSVEGELVAEYGLLAGAERVFAAVSLVGRGRLALGDEPILFNSAVRTATFDQALPLQTTMTLPLLSGTRQYAGTSDFVMDNFVGAGTVPLELFLQAGAQAVTFPSLVGQITTAFQGRVRVEYRVEASALPPEQIPEPGLAAWLLPGVLGLLAGPRRKPAC